MFYIYRIIFLNGTLLYLVLKEQILKVEGMKKKSRRKREEKKKKKGKVRKERKKKEKKEICGFLK